jgi:TRAP-type C4-dicarboxylate transport system permease small subunit
VALIVIALTLSAVTRYVSGNGYDWFIELPPVLICWLVFPLLGPLLYKGQHIQVDFLTSILTKKSILLVKLTNNLVVLIGSTLFFRAGIDATVLYYNMGQILEIQLEVPIWWMYLAFPTGFFILTTFAIELVLNDLSRLIQFKSDIN